MTIVPAGKTHIMEAQSISNPLSQGFGGDTSLNNNLPELETEKAMEEDLSVPNEVENTDVTQPQQEIGQQVSPVDEGKKKTLTSYIYKKLQSYGYPGRRLDEFKTKFVRESLSPDGVKDIQVELPDKKYSEQGLADSIDHEELRDIAQEINKLFGLNFNGAEHADGKWTVKFTSQKMTSPEDEQGGFRDGLEEVYGVPGKTREKEPEHAVKAFTLREMIKTQKDGMIHELKNIIGEKK